MAKTQHASRPEEAPRRPEQELREREEQYRAIFEATSDGMVIVDAEGRIVEANPAYCQMNGYTHHELVGLPLSTLVHPRHHSLVYLGLQRVLQGEPVQAQVENVRKDGTTFHAEGHATAFSYGGRPHVLVLIRDITERVRSEERLREQEQQYRSVFHSAADGLAIISLQGAFAEVNPVYARMHGYEPEEMTGRLVSEVIHPDDLPSLAAGIQATMAGQPSHAEFTAVRKDGTTFRAEGWSAPLTYQGQVHLLGWLRDITARVQTENELREKEAQWRRIFESSSDGLIINDPLRGVVVEANPAVCRMHGYTHDEFIGLHGTAFIHPDYHPVFADFLETIMAGGTYQTEAIDLRKDGSAVPVEVHGSSVMYQGRPHILAVVRDITQRVEAEQAVLEERQRLSRELHDSVSQALYSIALSARTARMLVEEHPEQAAEALDFTLNQAERGLAEMRALIFELRPESLEQEGLVSVLQKHADAVKLRHHIRVDTALGAEPDLSLPVKEALYRIAQEALHNTIKHASARAIRLGLDVGPDTITLLVEDDGKGFDPTGSFPGHIGLQSMRERVTRLSGTLQIESTPGIGTRVVAVVPYPQDATRSRP